MKVFMNKKHIALAFSLLSVSPSIQSNPGAGVIPLTLALFGGRLPAYRELRASTQATRPLPADQANTEEKQDQLMSAILFEKTNECVKLLEEGLIPDFVQKEFFKETPLGLACKNFSNTDDSSLKKLVALLLKYGACINRVDGFNRTALIHAIHYKRSTDFIQFLLEQGASPAIGSINILTRNGVQEMNALDLADHLNNQEVVKLLKRYGA
jgi:ankyrin repeat protein